MNRNQTRYEVLTYLLLFIVALVCLSQTGKCKGSTGLVNIVFLIVTLYAISGVLKYYFSDLYYIVKFHTFVLFLIASVALPCFMSDIFMKNRIVSKTVGFCHVLLGVTMAVSDRIGDGINNELFDVIIGVNVLTLLALSAIYIDFFAVCSSLLFIMAYFGCGQNIITHSSVYNEETYNYCMCCFCLCALQALKFK